MHYLIVLILLGMTWNNVFARGLDISEENNIAHKLDSLEERVTRLETEMGAHQSEETLKKIELEPNFYLIDSMNEKVGRPVETTNLNEQLEKVKQKLEDEFGVLLAELSSKYEDLFEKLANIEKRVEEKTDNVMKVSEEIPRAETNDSEESKLHDRHWDAFYKWLSDYDYTSLPL
ncbi:uncharacterized protein [Drosophila takahashii]|uniref:uncharacterized protein n=1 Tax=Drosophila takahashii TaxID=29030 RepID=UPI003898F38C